jgi:hypothetical protein
MVHHILFLNYFTYYLLYRPNTTDHSLSYSGVDLFRCVNPLRVRELRPPWQSHLPLGWEWRYRSLVLSRLGRFSLTGTQPPPPPRQTQVIDVMTDKARECPRWALSVCSFVARRLSPSVLAEWLLWGSECRPQTSAVSVAASVKLCLRLSVR